ncbi:MAG: protein-L-isoaspartate(D-aspartate) O-methyltransferase [Bacteriovoracaceae bacterium]|jgi:protein-L-isoaspartate(D-aspartate) O-methyltransferase|nr:protein-L-isoaspartate(D-aspartate) O-methyltransferase [Bacteriovoracaceae bacterium]
MKEALLTLGLFFILVSAVGKTDRFRDERSALLKIINSQFAESSGTTSILRMSPSVEKSMRDTPRSQFIPQYLRRYSYANRPLSIGHGQTISQPFIVALMTEVIRPKKSHVVLEVGTGSGYQAAVLSPLVKEVHSIEIIPQLAKKSKILLKGLGYKNIFSYTGDGYYGLSKHRQSNRKIPDLFDSIIVTAASSHIPPSLIKQLKIGGKMIIPVGGTFQVQYLILVEKSATGVKSKNILPVRFVPLTRN